MVTSYFEEREWKNSRIIFTVPLPEKESVFMSIDVNKYELENIGIVIVDAQKFLDLWRSDPFKYHYKEANGTPDTWPNDYKFEHAVEGFSHGRVNPVPLADVSYNTISRTLTSYRFLRLGKKVLEERVQYITFTNGITRTIWLLTNGCKAFPVKCRLSDAQDLFLVAGAEESSFNTVAELAVKK